ncbi:LysR family transcriptional regulator [Ancylobacter sonchi]|uniref:LysR family transcriptional regulator n=1 Tax=Ancylobacter sonchi TaxID=1937790 RepID=UPI001BD35093|nr:LysR substrate-binding domain-containing protein [Ancylobacter sonchi]MBS7534990.1 LysR family transcriptional regulator [Ancylobacter sonchi]
MDRPLDLDLVEAFVHVAELASFTRAAELDGTTQSAVSLKMRKLEARLGRILLERSPRLVRLTLDGERFLPLARDLLAAERRARLWEAAEPVRLRLGISDQVVGDRLAALVGRIGAAAPAVRLEVRAGFSRALLDAYDAGDLDAVLVRREGDRRDGEKLRVDGYGWFASPSLRLAAGEPVPLALLAVPCGVRAQALKALAAGGLGWREAFVGGSVAAVAAAVSAGLAVAPLALRLAPAGSREVGRDFDLPGLPEATVMLHARASEPGQKRALAALAAHARGVGEARATA